MKNKPPNSRTTGKIYELDDDPEAKPEEGSGVKTVPDVARREEMSKAGGVVPLGRITILYTREILYIRQMRLLRFLRRLISNISFREINFYKNFEKNKMEL